MVNLLIAKLTTNYTYFMREEPHYRFLHDVALPEFKARIRDHDLRTWSAGCSTGEEAYTAAIVMKEFFGPEAKSWDMTVLATDISPRVLSAAKEGKYPKESIEALSESYRKKYFASVSDTHCKVTPELAKSVVFGQFNLMDPFRFRRPFHVIFCRNVMIYFDNNTKRELAQKYFDALAPGGYLFIGLSETLSGIFTKFQHVAPSIYRKGN